MVSTIVWVFVISFVFGFLAIGGGMRLYYNRTGQDPNAKTAQRQSKGAQEER
jgi:hypothetical protein